MSQGVTTHDYVTDSERHRPVGTGSWVRQLLGFHKGAYILRDKYSDVLDEHMYDEMTEFPESELDVARVKAWTKELAEANDAWFKCKRKNGYTEAGACFEEGEQLRRAHWKHQLQIQEGGCERPLYRFAKCVQRAENRYHMCRDLESSFIKCTIDAGNMDLVPTEPPELMRLERYSGFFPLDIKLYKNWLKRRNEFLDSHPNWFSQDDVETMNSQELYKFISKKQEWLERGDKKPFSSYAYRQRYREYVPKKDRIVQ